MKRLIVLLLVTFLVETQVSKLLAILNYFETYNKESVSGGQKFSQLTDASITKNDKESIKYNLNSEKGIKIILRNSYKDIDWNTFKPYRANLHCHTLQSDGYRRIKEVIDTYKNAGFSIFSITDHDWNWPNARVTWGHLSVQDASPYPIGPLPKNFLVNPTWPRTDYEGLLSEEIEMVKIQGNELSFHHHINSCFSDYGVWYQRTVRKAPFGGITYKNGKIIWENNQLFDIWNKGGLAVLNHPSVSSKHNWWERKPLAWYVERFQKYSTNYLLGIEVANSNPETEKYDEALWGQLFARFMPNRPICRFGNDDMHLLVNIKDVHTVFLLNNQNSEAVRNAMESGQFYFCKSNRRIDLRKEEIGLFSSINNKIDIDEVVGTITIEASNYDIIKCISASLTFDPVGDYETSNQPWLLRQVVHEGTVLNYKTTPNVKNYIRIELHRIEGEHIYRTFTNPTGIGFFNKS